MTGLHCGSIGEPQPPLANIPPPAENLLVRQNAAGIVLEWTWPRVTTEGRPLTGITSFEVQAFLLPAGSGAPSRESFERASDLVATLEGLTLDSHSPGDRLRLVVDAGPWMDQLVAFAVRCQTRRRSSELSNIALVEVTSPPARPRLTNFEVNPDAILLEWPAAERADRYTVERSVADGDYEEIGIVAALRYRDPGYEFGVSYAYRVQGISDTSTGGVRGELSEPVSITPADVFPPSSPVGLRVVVTETSVELSWKPVEESDLAGYRVLRRDGDEEETLNQQLLLSPVYSDQRVQRGTRYVYQVTAVDRQGNQSPPSEPAEAVVP